MSHQRAHLRLRSDYLALVTLGFGEIIPEFFYNGDNVGGFNLTNGTQGIQPLDAVRFFTFDRTGKLVWGDLDTFADIPRFFIFCGLVALVIFASLRLRDGKLGRAWLAIREDELPGRGRPVDADQAVRVQRRGGRRRHRGRRLCRARGRVLPTGSGSTSRSPCRPWSCSAAWATSGVSPSAPRAGLTSTALPNPGQLDSASWPGWWAGPVRGVLLLGTDKASTPTAARSSPRPRHLLVARLPCQGAEPSEVPRLGGVLVKMMPFRREGLIPEAAPNWSYANSAGPRPKPPGPLEDSPRPARPAGGRSVAPASA